jgi:error-prone DNA polymerase
VIHVIVKHCYDLSKLLRGLTATDNGDSPLLTLSRADEKSIPAHALQNKKTIVREIAEKEIFPAGRNFK